MKARYLVVYDYGTGGLWAAIEADSEGQITARYPVLRIVSDTPDWLTEDFYNEVICAKGNCFAIDEPPPDWLLLAMKEAKY